MGYVASGDEAPSGFPTVMHQPAAFCSLSYSLNPRRKLRAQQLIESACLLPEMLLAKIRGDAYTWGASLGKVRDDYASHEYYMVPALDGFLGGTWGGPNLSRA